MNSAARLSIETIYLKLLGVQIRYEQLLQLPKQYQSLHALMVLAQDYEHLRQVVADSALTNSNNLIDSLYKVLVQHLDIYEILRLCVSRHTQPGYWRLLLTEKGNFTKTTPKDLEDIANLLGLTKVKKERLQNSVNAYREVLVIRSNPKLI